MAFHKLDGLDCVSIPADEPGMPPSYKCSLPEASHMCEIPVECALNHVPHDPNEMPTAYCHDGTWEIRHGGCVLEVVGFESTLIEAFFWITVVVIPFGGLVGCCCGFKFGDEIEHNAGRILAMFLGLLGGGVAIFVSVLLFFFVFVVVFSMPLVAFNVFAFYASIAIWMKVMKAKPKEEKEESKLRKIWRMIKPIWRLIVSAPLRALFLFTRWAIDLYIVAATLEQYMITPETPISFDFPILPDAVINLTGLSDALAEVVSQFDKINITSIIGVDFRCDGLVLLFGSFVLLAVELFILVFGATDYLGVHKVTDSLCKVELSGWRKGVYSKFLELLENLCLYGLQLVILIAQRRMGDVYRGQIYGECPIENASFAYVYGRVSTAFVLTCGILLWAIMINGHALGLNLQEKVQHPKLLKCLGATEEIGDRHPGPGEESQTIKDRLVQTFFRIGNGAKKEAWESNFGGAGFPLNQLYFMLGSFGIWTSWSCQGYRIKERKSWYEKQSGGSNEKADLHLTLAKATGKLISICWQVVPYIGIVMSKVTSYVNEDPNPLLVRDQVLKEEVSFVKWTWNSIQCVLDINLLGFLLAGVFQGGSASLTVAFWLCMLKAYLEKIEDIISNNMLACSRGDVTNLSKVVPEPNIDDSGRGC